MTFAENPSGPRAKELRRQAGRYVRDLRKDAGLTQRDVAELLGLDYYTFISQVETGMTRVPPAEYKRWAAALKVDVKEFVEHLLQFYDPYTHEALFGKPGRRGPAK